MDWNKPSDAAGSGKERAAAGAGAANFRLDRAIDALAVEGGRRADRPLRAVGSAAIGATAIGTAALGSLALGALAIGAVALGAFAIGRLSVGRVRVGRADLGHLRIGTLEIDEIIPPEPAGTRNLRHPRRRGGGA